MTATMETYIITPAEKPSAKDKKAVLVLLANRAIRLPIPVDNPVRIVKTRANDILLISISAFPAILILFLLRSTLS